MVVQVSRMVGGWTLLRTVGREQGEWWQRRRWRQWKPKTPQEKPSLKSFSWSHSHVYQRTSYHLIKYWFRESTKYKKNLENLIEQKRIDDKIMCDIDEKILYVWERLLIECKERRNRQIYWSSIVYWFYKFTISIIRYYCNLQQFSLVKENINAF